MGNKIIKTLSEIIKPLFITEAKEGVLTLIDKKSSGKTIDGETPKVVIPAQKEMICVIADQNNCTPEGNSEYFPAPYFAKKGDVCTVPENIIFYEKNNTLFIFIIELKSKNTGNATKKLRAGYELSKYLSGTARRLTNYEKFKFKFKFRGIIFTTKTTTKVTTKGDNLGFKQDKRIGNLKYMDHQYGDFNIEAYTNPRL